MVTSTELLHCWQAQTKTKREVAAMFMDEVVIAGLLIVGLTCAFFVGVYIAIKKDIEKHGTGE